MILYPDESDVELIIHWFQYMYFTVPGVVLHGFHIYLKESMSVLTLTYILCFIDIVTFSTVLVRVMILAHNLNRSL